MIIFSGWCLTVRSLQVKLLVNPLACGCIKWRHLYTSELLIGSLTFQDLLLSSICIQLNSFWEQRGWLQMVAVVSKGELVEIVNTDIR